MADRDMSPEAREQWSERNQTLRHSGVKRPGDDDALLHDPFDYSAVGGPENEPAYGRTRSDSGNYPFNSYHGPYDRDSLAHSHGRGGYMKLHPADHGANDPGQARYRGYGPRAYRRPDERLHEEIREHLTEHDQIDISHIEVSVSEGQVMLQGTVATRLQKRLAEEATDSVRGVKGVVNELRVEKA